MRDGGHGRELMGEREDEEEEDDEEEEIEMPQGCTMGMRRPRVRPFGSACMGPAAAAMGRGSKQGAYARFRHAADSLAKLKEESEKETADLKERLRGAEEVAEKERRRADTAEGKQRQLEDHLALQRRELTRLLLERKAERRELRAARQAESERVKKEGEKGRGALKGTGDNGKGEGKESVQGFDAVQKSGEKEEKKEGGGGAKGLPPLVVGRGVSNSTGAGKELQGAQLKIENLVREVAEKEAVMKEMKRELERWREGAVGKEAEKGSEAEAQGVPGNVAKAKVDVEEAVSAKNSPAESAAQMEKIAGMAEEIGRLRSQVVTKEDAVTRVAEKNRELTRVLNKTEEHRKELERQLKRMKDDIARLVDDLVQLAKGERPLTDLDLPAASPTSPGVVGYRQKLTGIVLKLREELKALGEEKEGELRQLGIVLQSKEAAISWLVKEVDGLKESLGQRERAKEEEAGGVAAMAEKVAEATRLRDEAVKKRDALEGELRAARSALSEEIRRKSESEREGEGVGVVRAKQTCNECSRKREKPKPKADDVGEFGAGVKASRGEVEGLGTELTKAETELENGAKKKGLLSDIGNF